MGQRQPFSAADDNAWLSNLVDTFERTEQLHDETCSPAVISAAMARLKRPAAARRHKTARQTARRTQLLELSF